MILRYETLLGDNSNKSVGLARKVLTDGWVLGKYPSIKIDESIPWAFIDQNTRSWNFHIHCWDMLDALCKAYSETGDSLFLKAALPIIIDWVRYSNDKLEELSPFAWYDMSVGVRAYRLAFLYDVAKDMNLLSEEEISLLWASLELHQAYLADERNISFHNNHGYYQVAGQLAMGRRFSNSSPLMADALEQGKARLKLMLNQQFAADGIHREHSPDYHRMVYDTLKALIDSGLVEDKETIIFSKKVEKALSWFVLPNQRILNFGDSDYRLLRRKPLEAERKWLTEEMRYMVTGGSLGSVPSEVVAAFPEGGFFVVRKPSIDQPEDFSKNSYLAQIAAFHSRTHKHADDLSFIWADRGSEILVDAGRYGYIGKAEQGSDLWLDGHWYSDPNRVYCESTRAHNTLEFDGKNYPRKGVKPYGSALKRWVETDSRVIAVETECKHFGSIRRVRVLVFMPGKWLIVFDWFNDNLQTPHNAKQWFHLAPHLQLHLDNGGYLVPFQSSETPLRVVSLLDEPFASRPYLGEHEPVMQGWWSSKERDIVPNYAFCFEQSDIETGAFATLFSFSNNLTPDAKWSKVNTSGRKGQFRWVDEQGSHVVRLDRPEKGEFEVTYTCS